MSEDRRKEIVGHLSEDDLDRLLSEAADPKMVCRLTFVNLVEEDGVRLVPEHRILVHEPSDEAVDSIQQLGIFHRGWVTSRDTIEEE